MKSLRAPCCHQSKAQTLSKPSKALGDPGLPPSLSPSLSLSPPHALAPQQAPPLPPALWMPLSLCSTLYLWIIRTHPSAPAQRPRRLGSLGSSQSGPSSCSSCPHSMLSYPLYCTGVGLLLGFVGGHCAILFSPGFPVGPCTAPTPYL